MLVVVSNIVERIFQINDRRSQDLRGFYLFWFSGIRCVLGMRTVIQKSDFYQKMNEPSLKYLLWSITFYRGFSKSMNQGHKAFVAFIFPGSEVDLCPLSLCVQKGTSYNVEFSYICQLN